MIERIPGATAPPKPVCEIRVLLFEDMNVAAVVKPTLPPHVVAMMLDKAKADLVAAIEKKQAAGPGIEVAPPGMSVERNGG